MCFIWTFSVVSNLSPCPSSPLVPPPEFIKEYRKRAKIEPKNAELKRFHGLDRTKGFGLRSIRIQAKLTALAVNLKRIAKMVSALKGLPSFILKLLSCRVVINRPDWRTVAAQAA